MTFTPLWAIVGTLGLSIWAQSSLPNSRRLERWWELGMYERIIQLYERYPSAFIGDQVLYVAGSYAELGESEKAFHLYEQAASRPIEGWKAEHLLRFGSLLHMRGDIEQAKRLFGAYAEKVQSPSSADHAAQLERCATLPHSSNWRIERVEGLAAWAPVYAAWRVGDELYAVSRARRPGARYDHHGLPYEWIVPRSPTSYPYHHALIGLVPPDTLLLYISRGKGDIYYTVPTPQGYTRPKLWKRIPTRPRGRVSVCIDPKTQDIYFTYTGGSSSSYKRDIYRCIYTSGQYSEPQRLPPPINTEADEDAPFIFGDTLYFASNGARSAGGYDIFFSVRSGERDWTAPQALPAPINSCANDIYFYPFSPDHIYFSSDRGGKFFVYRAIPVESTPSTVSPTPVVEAPPPTHLIIKGYIYDKQSSKRISGEAILVDPITQKEILASFASDNGDFQFFLPKKGGSFYLYVQSPGYITHVQLLQVSPDSLVPPLSIPLLPIEMEATFALRNIYFDFNSDQLRPESIPELQRLRRLLQENPNIRVRFSGHTDAIGSDEYNQKLSERRARAVYNWLRQAGIHPIQMEYVGYGKSRPLASNATEEGRALNRRIEMEVVGIRKAPSGASAARD
ncbi:MAG: OmpA family protein [Bacteroidia bacterium]|nr:OmpA family protein [Bacteroidia bacterium]MDW8015799.1 OmpA family protein [Bacteroidia bacterium]